MTQRIPVVDPISAAWQAINHCPLPKALMPMYAPKLTKEAEQKRASRARKEAHRWHDLILG